jgi:phage tail protein X
VPQRIVIHEQGASLDLLLWRAHGRKGQSLVEAALVANPGLAALGPTIPQGTAILIPDLPPPPTGGVVEQPTDIFG